MAQAAASKAARILRDAIAQRGVANFVVATGTSQFGFLNALVAEPDLRWESMTMFHLDEYIGLSADHPASFRRYLRERLTSRVPIGTVNFIQGDAENLDEELHRLNRILGQTTIGVAFVGIGENGHLAFNDPPADFAVEIPFGEGWLASFEDVATRAISMSIRQIMKAKQIICTVPERRKSQAVKACLEGAVGPMVPASILRTHPNCFLFLDREAGSQLSS
jgi:glucosamine-6-phosphate deaminase